MDEFDFLPLTERVTIRGKTFDVRGLDIPEIATIIRRFKDVQDMRSLGMTELLNLSGPAVGAIIAASVGKLGDEKVERSFSNLALGEKAEIIAKVLTITAPTGFGPFVDLMKSLGIPVRFVEALEELGAAAAESPPSSEPSAQMSIS